MEYKNLTLSKLLTSTPILCELVKKVEELTKLNKVVLSQLDPKLARHCRVHSYEAGILTLSTHSSAWGHTLRFAESDLLSHLRSYPEWCGLKSIRSRVLPPIETHIDADTAATTQIIAATRKTPLITKKDAEILKQTAKHIASESLKKALLKLASRPYES